MEEKQTIEALKDENRELQAKLIEAEKRTAYMIQSVDDIKSVYETQIDYQNLKIQSVIGYCRWLLGTKTFKLFHLVKRIVNPIYHILDLLEKGDEPISENSFSPRNDERSAIFEGNTDPKDAPLISIVVLTYNNLVYNKICVDSILSKTIYPNFELILVDNGSTDGTKEWLHEVEQKQLPNVKIIFIEENVGFAAGNNIGIKETKGEYVVLLNNDTCVTNGWLSGMVKHLMHESILGMVGPVTNSTGNEAKIKVEYCDFSSMQDFANKYTSEHRGELWKEPRMVAFFCVMIKREVIEKCGLLSEDYGRGFFEDDDYCMAVRQAGYRIAIAEDSFVHHFQSQTFDKLEETEYKELFDTNREIFEKRWNIKWIPHRYRYGIDRETNESAILLVM